MGASKIEWTEHTWNPVVGWPSQVLREPYATEMICVGKKRAGRLLDGELFDGMPT